MSINISIFPPHPPFCGRKITISAAIYLLGALFVAPAWKEAAICFVGIPLLGVADLLLPAPAAHWHSSSWLEKTQKPQLDDNITPLLWETQL